MKPYAHPSPTLTLLTDWSSDGRGRARKCRVRRVAAQPLQQRLRCDHRLLHTPQQARHALQVTEVNVTCCGVKRACVRIIDM